MKVVLLFAFLGAVLGAAIAVDLPPAIALGMSLIGCIAGAAMAGPVLVGVMLFRVLGNREAFNAPTKMKDTSVVDRRSDNWHWRDPVWRALHGLPRNID